MTSTDFILYKDSGQIVNKKSVRLNFDNLPDGKYLVMIKDATTRTLKQNAYLHLMFTYVQRGLYDNGYREVKTADQAKQVCKELFLSYDVTNEKTGAKMKLVKRTRDLTKEEMSTFIDEVIQWAAEYLSVVIPEPSSQIEIF